MTGQEKSLEVLAVVQPSQNEDGFMGVIDALDEIEKRWHSAECYMGQAFEAATARQFGYFNQKAWLEFRQIKRLFRAMKPREGDGR